MLVKTFIDTSSMRKETEILYKIKDMPNRKLRVASCAAFSEAFITIIIRSEGILHGKRTKYIPTMRAEINAFLFFILSSG